MEPRFPTLQVDSLPSEPCQRTPRNQTTVRALKECQKEQPWGNVIKKIEFWSSSSMLLVSTLLNILQNQCVMLELQALAFLLAQMVKNLPAMQETQVCLIPGSGRSPGEQNAYPTPVFLPGESHGQRSLVGYSPWGHKESSMTLWLNQGSKDCKLLICAWNVSNEINFTGIKNVGANCSLSKHHTFY